MNKEKFFEFYMNKRYWKIYEKSQQEMKDYYNEDGADYYYGQIHFSTQEIWLSDDIPPTQLDKTLFHELMHCYIRMYITTQELEFNEESLCDISSNAYSIINGLIDDYRKYLTRTYLKGE